MAVKVEIQDPLQPFKKTMITVVSVIYGGALTTSVMLGDKSIVNAANSILLPLLLIVPLIWGLEIMWIRRKYSS